MPSVESFRNRKKRCRLGRSYIVAVVALFTATSWHSANATYYTRNNAAANLETSGAWGSGPPNINDVALWSNASATSNILGANRNFLALEFTASGEITISGSGVLTLGGASLGNANGGYPTVDSSIDMSSTGGNVNLQTALSLLSNSGQIWNINTGRVFTLSTGAFSRGASSTLNIRGAGSVIANTISNDVSGIIGAWVTIGTGTSMSYARVHNTTKAVEAFTYGTTSSALNTLTNAAQNYQTNNTGAFGAGTTFHTLRYNGAAGEISGNYTTNGILMAGSGDLTLSGDVIVGSTNELILTTGDSARTMILSGKISNGASASKVVISGDGVTALSGDNDYTGETVVTRGTLEIRSNNALGSTSAGTTIYTASKARLSLRGGITTNEAFTFTGGDPTNSYYTTLHNAAGTNYMDGAITLQGSLRMGSGGSGTVLHIRGGITGAFQLVFNMAGGEVNISQNIVNIGSNSFHSDQTATIRVGVSGNIWGNTVIANNTVMIMEAANALPTTTAVQFGVTYSPAASVLNLNGFNQTITRIFQQSSTPGTITSATAATLTVNQSSTDLFTGAFTGQLAITKGSTGTMMLGADNTNTGDTIISGGSIQLNKHAANTETVTLSGNASVTVANGALYTVGQSVSGTGIQAGTMISAISGNNITLSRAATVSAPSDVTFGALEGTLSGSTVNYNNQGGSLTFGRYTTSTEIGGIKGAQNLSLLNVSGGAVALTVGGNDVDNVYTGAFTGAGGSIIKTGTGIAEFGGNSTYTGGTTVNEGTLLATNTAGSATGTGSVTVGNARLGGTGSITGGSSQSITLGANSQLMVGRTHAAGGSAQSLTLGRSAGAENVAINLNGTLQFDLFSQGSFAAVTDASYDVLGSANDLLELHSTSSINLDGGRIYLSASSTFGWDVNQRWKLIDWSNTGMGSTSVSTTGLQLMTTSIGGYDLVGEVVAGEGYYVRVASAVPEPTRALLVFTAAACLILRRRRDSHAIA